LKLVTDYLDNSCQMYSDKIAVRERDSQVTYKELCQASKKIATVLLNYIAINEPVMVFMDKGIETLESFMGILYAGGCYSLVNPTFPESRILQISTVLESKVVITNEKYLDNAKRIFKDVMIFTVSELLTNTIDEEALEHVKSEKIDLDPVYIHFTSGSTGVPKGVVVGHRSIIDFIAIFTKEFQITKEDVIANQAPFDFDVSVKDIYSSFCVGATLVIVPKEFFSSPAILLDYLVDYKITTMIWAVSALCLITTFHGLDYKVPTTVNKILFSGEVMPIKHLKQWMDKLPEAMFVNLYGPTEITCNCSFYKIDRSKEYTEIPIGKHFINERIILLDENSQEVKEELVSGEICVVGSCLALGYYNNVEQTNQAFVQNPLHKKYNEFLYRTGDLAKYDKEGNLIFVGRKDFQIKYQGHRIELEEIDRQILKIDEIKRVCTLFYEKKNKLYCFYIGDVTKEDIVLKLKKDVPSYMIPSKFVQVDNFLLNKNGKIDRKKLFSMIEEGI